MAITGINKAGMGMFSQFNNGVNKLNPIQTGATKPGLAQNFASKGFTMPGGLVDKPSQDAYMKAKIGTLGGYNTQDEARMASALNAKKMYEARNLPVPQQILDTLAGNYGKDHAGETMSAPALNPQGQPWSKPQGYAPSYQNLRLAAAQDVLSGQPNGGAPAWAREPAGNVAPAPANVPAPYSAQPPGVTVPQSDPQLDYVRQAIELAKQYRAENTAYLQRPAWMDDANAMRQMLEAMKARRF